MSLVSVYYAAMMRASTLGAELNLFVPDMRTFLRNVMLPLTALASVFLFPSDWLVIAFLVLGQAHFAMAMLYQYRGGRVDRRYLLTLAALVAGFVLYFTLGGGFYPIFFLAVLMFAVHFAYDEFHLQKCERKAPQVVTLALFLILFLVMNLFTLVPAYASLALAVALVFPAYILSRLFFSNQRPNKAEAYVWFVGMILFVLTFGFHAEPVILLAIVSILHISNWYVDYGRRLADAGNALRLRSYWLEVVGLIAVMAILFVMYRVFGVAILQYLFVVMYYYAFAISHFILSIKRQGRKV